MSIEKAPTWILAMAILAAFTVALVAVMTGSREQQQAMSQDSQDKALETPLGYTISEGAAPGYIDDQACATCHTELHASYQHVGMAKSFARPEPANYIEDFEAEPYFHPASERYYEMRLRGDDIVFKRYQLDDNRQPINVIERQVDWLLGSGNKTRSYLYQTKAGEIFELPIGWYSETGQWRMAPGYDSKHHMGVQRSVRRECMFCHNAFPDTPAGTDKAWEPHNFPKELPEGTGCQRCHGPGGQHVQTVLRGGQDRAAIQASIVNPARLSPERRDSVCFQCHLLPAIAMVGLRRFDRSDYSFRPGELLSDYMLHVDIMEEGRTREERFEINHQAYRLQLSACFQKSSSELTCISCHNPHRKVTEEERATHYAAVCLKCHQAHTTNLPTSVVAANDCVNCHMPQRRTQDVIHVVMTDHKIQRMSPPGAERLAPIQEIEHTIKAIEFMDLEKAPSGALGDIYKLVTVVRNLTTDNLVDQLEKILADARLEDTTPYFYLASAQLKLKRYTRAEQTLNYLLGKHPGHFKLLQWMGLALMGQDRLEESEQHMRNALSVAPELGEIHYNLSLVLLHQNKLEEALGHLRQTIENRPYMPLAWYYLAEVSAELNQSDKAVGYYQRALEIEPSLTLAYLGMARVLQQQGDKEGALRFLKHGLKVANQPATINKALGEFDS